MDTLGTFLKDTEPPEEARLWHEKGVALGKPNAIYSLGSFAGDSARIGPAIVSESSNIL